MPEESKQPTYEELEQKVAALEKKLIEQRQDMVCPLDYKYDDPEIKKHISSAAVWRGCAEVQLALMKGRLHFEKATPENVAEMEHALTQFSPANADKLEGKLRHDQLAVIAELAKYVSQDTADKMHPGTTSYDILDTARNKKFKDVAQKVIIPKAKELLKVLVDLAKTYKNRVQIGRTHDQWTSPITFGYSIAIYADRLAGRIDKLEEAANNLEGKISGIVGTSASVATVIGDDIALEFERYVLEELIKLKVCRHPTQVVSKEVLADYANALVSMQGVMADAANTMRHLQASEIAEVSGRQSKQELGGSSADPSKNNPINFENVNGVWETAIGGMATIYHMQVSDHQRDLRGSVQARYEPQHIIGIVYDSLKRMAKQMGDLAVNETAMDRNLDSANRYPAEAMNAVLKAHNYPDAHKTVKEWAKGAMKEGVTLLEYAMKEERMRQMWEDDLTYQEKDHLKNIRTYIGKAVEKTDEITSRLEKKYF